MKLLQILSELLDGWDELLVLDVPNRSGVHATGQGHQVANKLTESHIRAQLAKWSKKTKDLSSFWGHHGNKSPIVGVVPAATLMSPMISTGTVIPSDSFAIRVARVTR
jgi:hypothetical protein